MRNEPNVSIPNGMEFYGERILCVVWNYSGFNSQWDGILHFETLDFPSFSPVSIPNGMEFYQSIVNCWQDVYPRFNSQWDGILLAADGTVGGSLEFQFPMGWNSTRGF